MHLERASQHSGEAGLAGWISSNDVTLFTVVLVVAIALFLQSNLVRGSKKNEQLEGQNAQLQDQKQAALAEIDRVSADLRTTEQQLSQVRQQLQDAQQQLDSTQQKLTSTSQALDSTRTELTNVRSERDRLDQQRKQLDEQLAAALGDVKSLKAALDSMQLEKSNLLATKQELDQQKISLTQEKEKLLTDNASLDRELADLTAKLTQRLKDLDDLQKERMLLEEKANALAERVKRLEQVVGERETALASLKESSQLEMEEMKKLLTRAMQRHELDQTVSAEKLEAAMARLGEVEAAAVTSEKTAADYLDRLKRAAVYVRGIDEKKKLLQLEVEALKTQLANVLDDLEQAKQQVVVHRDRERTINRELVGLRGDLHRVAIVFDSSGSMNEDNRWGEVQRIASTWLDHLEVDECVLIVFASDVTTFPEDGSMLRVSGPDGTKNRQKLMQRLQEVQPEGWTNTLAAMYTAYKYPDLDTIILFSDGAPTLERSNVFNADAADQIYAMCREHKDIPINAIGLGNYFNAELSTFLRTLAEISGGTFLGR